MLVKLISFISLVVVGACFAARYPLYYNLGYREESYSPFVYLDVLWLIQALSVLFLTISCIVSLVCRKSRIWTAGMMIGLLVLVVLASSLPPPSRGLVNGLRDRLVHDNSLDDLRRFAQDFHKLPRLAFHLPGDTKEYMREDLDKTSLKSKYLFLSWMKADDFNGPSAVYEDDGVIEVRWGAALEGHWGFSISIDGSKLPPESEPGGLRVSDDILVVSELD